MSSPKCQMRENKRDFGWVIAYRDNVYAGDRMWTRGTKFAEVFDSWSEAKSIARRYRADVMRLLAGRIM